MRKVYCIGELLIDFVGENQGADLAKALQFTKKAGGAPANVASAVAKLGGESEFVGSVGKDAFGSFLTHTLQQNKVGTKYLQQTNTFTTLAFVSLAENGERDFVFSRGADKELEYDRNLKDQFANAIVHFGAATSFLGGSLEKTYEKYLEEVVAKNAFVSFDPNYRVDLWKGKTAVFVEKCKPFIQKADFAKFSEEEAFLISEKDNLIDACHKLHAEGVKVIAVTMGSKGTFLSTQEKNAIIESVPVNAVDTTGAGDAFVGCFLYLLSKENRLDETLLDFNKLKEMVAIANKAGAHTTTQFGAIDALPFAKDLGL
ncbi:carbohydrate kinase family protein [Galbibacter mesophilus]|uniref:carbohydrate kinase family protein n=1 Tax=Galbibacter mesophilus TaxID=379069 RepID=UPI00191CBF12|nr:carbohydrate kinase [Galbibacter mesophilus]MCM5662441.1 carbohydrate kinase [Galbibacter mesophilus]